MINISHIPRCYGNTVAMATRGNVSNFFVLSRFEFMFGMQVPWSNKHQPHTSLLW